MPSSVVVLGAGFGGLELTTILSETVGDTIDIVKPGTRSLMHRLFG